MKKTLLASLLCAFATFSSCASAAPNTDFAVDAGTLGLGLTATTPVAPGVDFRSGFHVFNHDYNTTSDGVAYNGKLKLASAMVVTDWHPFGGAFRLTGGLVFNNNKFDLTGQPAGGNFTINGVQYPATAAGSVTAKVTFDPVAPYLGFGWNQGSPDSEGLHFTSDIGVMYQGSPKVSLTASGAASDPALAADLATAQDALRKQLNNYKFYPVIQVGIAYRF